MAHWTDKYVGLPYVPNEFDCAHLVVKVQNEQFNQNISMPIEREGHVFLLSKQIDEHLHEYYEEKPKEQAQEGDMVLMRCRGRLNHIGIYVVVNGVPYVLHNIKNLGSVALHRIRELDKYGVVFDSVYALKTRD